MNRDGSLTLEELETPCPLCHHPAKFHGDAHGKPQRCDHDEHGYCGCAAALPAEEREFLRKEQSFLYSLEARAAN